AYLHDTRPEADQLTDKLAAISRERPDRMVFIRADDQVAYGEVVRTMAAIKAAGIENVGMVTQMPGSASGDQADAGNPNHKRGSSTPERERSSATPVLRGVDSHIG